jgi:membrane-bound serine protease (ClpP class)
MLTLVAAPVPELEISPAVAIGVSLAFGLITVMLVRLAFKARRMKARIGADALVGARATAMEEMTPEGHVLVEGEIWRATAAERVEKGAPLRVTSHEAYMLRVERV